MTDKAILEAAARALQRDNLVTEPAYATKIARTAFAAAIPLIRTQVLKEAAKVLNSIEWRSADKDNMEFTATITYSQMAALCALKEQP